MLALKLEVKTVPFNLMGRGGLSGIWVSDGDAIKAEIKQEGHLSGFFVLLSTEVTCKTETKLSS